MCLPPRWPNTRATCASGKARPTDRNRSRSECYHRDMRRTVFIASGLIVSVLTLAVVAQQATVETRPPNAPTQKPAVAGQTRVPEQRSNVVFDVVTVAE